MSGTDAARGFRYQYLCTLEHTLGSWLSPDRHFTAVRVDSDRSFAGPAADAEIIDFEIVEGGRSAIAAQVKGGIPGSRFTAADALRILLRLLTNDADRYLVITNRQAGQSLDSLRQLMARHAAAAEPVDRIRDGILRELERSHRVRELLLTVDETWWERLRHAEIEVDTREPDEIEEHIRELVRRARHHADPSSIGWDAAGLVSKYLAAVMLDAAAGDGDHHISHDDLTGHLLVDPEVARSLLWRKDWAVHVLPAPRSTDVGRGDLLNRIAAILPTPLRGPAVPVCVLFGLSGIGKSSIAAAWADDRADAYAEIYWIDASSTATVRTSFAMIARWLADRGLPSVGTDPRERVFTGLAASPRPWLMVFDNAVDPRDTAGWIPRRGLGHVIVTTVRPGRLAGAQITELEITPMSTQESMQLLSLRLAAKDPAPEEIQRLAALAGTLHRWPLALELAAAYLRNCLDGLAGLGQFEQLVMRSLNDADSVPDGYPTTLVQAIRLSWRRLAEQTAATHQHAVFALQCAAFTGSRQIPLQLLLAAGVVDSAAFLDSSSGFVGYSLSDPPVGEVLRAMRSYSLITRDRPLAPTIGEKQTTPSEPGYTVSMNEIVQTVIRDTLVDETFASVVVDRLAAVVQQWLTAAHTDKQFGMLRSIVGHAVVVGEHALARRIKTNATALLWGNTGTVLRNLGYPVAAVPYLTFELQYLRAAPTPLPVHRMQTTAGLADARVSSVDDPREIVDEVADLLEECLLQVNEVLSIDREVAARTLRIALAVALALSRESSTHTRLCQLRQALEDYVRITPVEGQDTFQQLADINTLVLAGKYAEARTRIERLLRNLDPYDPEGVSCIGMLAECETSLGDWKAARRTIDLFSQGTQQSQIYRHEAGRFCRNVGIACLREVITRNPDAIQALDAVLAIVDEAESYDTTIQAVNRSMAALLRAIRSCIRHDARGAKEALTGVRVADLPKTGNVRIFPIAHQLTERWAKSVPEELTHRQLLHDGSNRTHRTHSTGPSVSEIPAALHEWAVTAARPETAVLMILTSEQWRLSGGHAPRPPLEVTMALKHALNLFGIEAELLTASVDIFRSETDLTIHENRDRLAEFVATMGPPVHTTDKTFGLWIETFDAFVDPTPPHLSMRYRNLVEYHPADDRPTVLPANRRAFFRSPIHTLRAKHLLRYRELSKADPPSATDDLSAQTHLRCSVDGLFVAMVSAFALFALPADRVDEITTRHPQLRELAVLG